MQKTKLLLLATLLLIAGVAKAESTTDKVVISSLTVEPGSSTAYSFTVMLEGSQFYTAFQIDLQFPNGLEPAYNSSGKLRVSMDKTSKSVYPYSIEEEEDDEGEIVETKVYTHTPSSSMPEVNTLRVIVSSNQNEEFTKTSGNLFKVYVNALPYLKPGDVEILVKDVELTTSDAVAYTPADYVSTAVQAEATSTLALKVSASNQYSTCILPFDYDLSDGSLVAYTCNSHTEDALLLTKADKILAYTPYILYSEAGFEATISGIVDPTKYPEGGIVKSGHLVGTVVKQELTEGYVMQNQGEGAKFYRVASGTPFAIPAGKCYVELPAGEESPSFRFAEDTGIENLEFRTPISEYYNVMGQRVSRLTAGQIYIIDGRKVIAE